MSDGSLTFDISGDAFDAWFTTSWGKANALRPSEGVSVDAWRECGGGGVEQ